MSACNTEEAGGMGLIPGSGRSPGGGNDNPLQYSCLENPMDSGVWWAIVHGVSESDMTEYARTIRNKASVAIDVWELVDQLKFGRFLYFPQKMNF